MNDNLDKIYAERFKNTFQKREITWNVLSKYYFQSFIPKNSVILEVAAGYCHFINNIKGAKKYALDMNPDVKKYASSEVQVIIGSSTQIPEILENSIDVIFISNFFEHLKKEDILATLQECKRVLKPDGKIIILQPNIRFLAHSYWMFFDHITPLDDYSLTEALILAGFKVKKVIPKFLPFTLQSRLPVNKIFIRLYLLFPLAWKILGKQSLLFGEK